jgi:hypothetical protein
MLTVVNEKGVFMKLTILALCLVSFSSILSFAASSNSTCHAQVITAAEQKALAEGKVLAYRLFTYEVSLKRAGFNLYVVTLKQGENEPDISYHVFSNYQEQEGQGQGQSKCEILDVI